MNYAEKKWLHNAYDDASQGDHNLFWQAVDKRDHFFRTIVLTTWLLLNTREKFATDYVTASSPRLFKGNRVAVLRRTICRNADAVLLYRSQNVPIVSVVEVSLVRTDHY